MVESRGGGSQRRKIVDQRIVKIVRFCCLDYWVKEKRKI